MVFYVFNEVGEIRKICSYFLVSTFIENKHKAHFKPCTSKRENPHKSGTEKDTNTRGPETCPVTNVLENTNWSGIGALFPACDVFYQKKMDI